MRDAVYKAVRTAQSHFPGFVDRKYAVQRWLRRVRRVPFEPDFLALRFLPDDEEALYLDVGGNRGQSIDAVLLTTAAGRVWSFEPNPVLADRLAEEYRDNPRVEISPFGLGDAETVHTLYVPGYRGYLYDGLASFDRAEAVGWLPGRMYGYREDLLTVHEYQCQTRRLDDLDCRPAFLKVDVQGFEYEVIAGGRATLSESDPVTLVENPSPQLLELFGRLGYQRFAFDGHTFRRGVPGGLNDFFLSDVGQERLRAGGASFA